MRFLGFRQDASTILAAADVFVFSSLMEGLGTAVLEAMAARVPVVAFDFPRVREITNEGRVAHLVPVGNAERLADATTAVLARTAPDLTDLAHQWICDRYDIQAVAHELQTYLEVVAAST
jgi:glycosyltransferase involved in cell wall biosynthesis